MSHTASEHVPEVGVRLIHSGHLGTVRFVGTVDGTQGIWLGVEWDDPKRGKHDGTKDGRRYFSCIVPNTGSFIRPNASIIYGKSILEALVSKYTDDLHGSGPEKVILGSSNGAIEVEAVGLDKIRANLSRLERLREVSLDNECISKADSPGRLKNTCPSIRGLDLSKNLLPSWDVVALIATELPHLESLALNQNRLTMPTNIVTFRSAFTALKELQINSTLTTWRDAARLLEYLPNIRLIEAGYNRLTQLDPGGPISHPTLQTVNLDGNSLTDWAEVCGALCTYSSLQRLILSENHIETIGAPSHLEASLMQYLKHLSLTSNNLNNWESVNHIARWCPVLESLTLSGNALFEDPEQGKHARQLIIAKIATLTALDAAAITAKERTDCELFYLSYINKTGPHSDEERCRQHPRWPELCNKYGRPDPLPAVGREDKHDTLSNRLIRINVVRYSHPPSVSTASITQTMTLRVLPSMSMRAFRMKVAKSFKVPRAAQSSMALWVKMSDGTLADVGSANDTHDLSWLGLEDNSEIVFHTE